MTFSRRICSVPSCDHHVAARDLCYTHYTRLRVHGDVRPDDPIGYRPPTPPKPKKPYRCSCAEHTGVEDWHGTLRGYKWHRCPCEPCRDAGRARDKARWINRYAAKHGISVERLRELLATKRCEICGTTDPGKSPWHIDHDHSCCPGGQNPRGCGKCIRGVLCSQCNYLLSNARDNPAILRSAIDYLERHSTPTS